MIKTNNYSKKQFKMNPAHSHIICKRKFCDVKYSKSMKYRIKHI